MTFVRYNIPPLEAPVLDAEFPNGGTFVVVGVRFLDKTCGCTVDFGIRFDNQEKAMLSHPCATHEARWDEVLAALKDSDEPTEVALDRGLEAIS